MRAGHGDLRQVIVLNHGRVIAEGPPAVIQSHPAVIRAYLGVGRGATVRCSRLEGLRAAYGPVEALARPGSRGAGGRAGLPDRRQRRRQDVHAPRDLRAAAGPRAGRIVFDGPRDPGPGARRRSSTPASPTVPRAAACSRISPSRRTSRWAPTCAAIATPIAEDLERVCTHFPILAERRRQMAGTLSGGEQQMLAIGRALMARPAAHPVRRALAGARPHRGGDDVPDDRRHPPATARRC